MLESIGCLLWIQHLNNAFRLSFVYYVASKISHIEACDSSNTHLYDKMYSFNSWQFDCLMQKRHNSIANALELHLFCIKPLNLSCTICVLYCRYPIGIGRPLCVCELAGVFVAMCHTHRAVSHGSGCHAGKSTLPITGMHWQKWLKYDAARWWFLTCVARGTSSCLFLCENDGSILLILSGLYYTLHVSEIIMSTMASQITMVLIVCSTVCSGIDKKIKALHHWLL